MTRLFRIRGSLFATLAFLLLTGRGAPLRAQSDGDPVTYTAGHYRILHSDILQEDRTLLVSLPQGYERSQRRYPVLVVLDGSAYTLSWARGSALERGIPPLVTVAVANTDRRRDLTLGAVEAWNTPGGAEAFRDFVTGELLPFLDREYRTTPYRILAGTSAAGFFTAFTYLTRPDAFQAYIATSPMFVGSMDWVMARARRPTDGSTSTPVRLAFIWGAYDYPGATLFAPDVAATLRASRGASLEVSEDVLAEKAHGQFASLNLGLTRIFHDFAFPTEAYLSGAADAPELRLRALSARLGTPLEAADVYSPSEMVFQGSGLMAAGRHREARRVLEYGLSLYPESARILYRLGQAQLFSGEETAGRETLLRAAALDGSGGLAGMVERWLREWDSPGGGELVDAAMRGRLDAVEEVLAREPRSLDRPDAAGYTALRWAAIRGHGDVARFLTRAGADPNTVGHDGGTPLHGAAHHDDAPLMAALLDAGGDVTVRNRWGRTPLHVAARRGCLSVARLLLEAGADPNAVTNEGWSALDVAYRGGHPEMVALLLDGGADPELADLQGHKPGDTRFTRGTPISLSRRDADAFVGHYDLGEGAGFDVWREGDGLRLMEFAPDDLIPVGVDTFHTAREPWRAVFHRDESGAVASLEVSFIRQTVVAQRVRDPSGGIAYVGSAVCLGCHDDGAGGGPAGHWIASRHSRALHTLSSDQARGLAAQREEYRDITDPSQDMRCVRCHVTAAQNPAATFGPRFRRSEGVGCEACHGPGGEYATRENMRSRSAFLEHGGRIPDELTCRGCHRDENFRFLPRLERIRHW